MPTSITTDTFFNDNYFDDFDATKNYLRILFNPSRAVQARELTQLQTLLHNQISTFANHVFKDGSNVLNSKIKVNFEKSFIVLNNVTNLEVGEVLVLKSEFGLTTTKKAVVTHITGTTAMVDYLQGEFAATDVITVDDITDYTVSSVGTGVTADMEAGIVYVGGSFVIVDEQSIVVDSTGNTGDYKIGFLFDEEAHTSTDDSTLLDNATGSYNQNAPGADRYKGTATLVSYTGASPSNFYSAIIADTGVIIKEQTDVQYSDILDVLARRTYDESGNYTVRRFPLSVENNVDTSKYDYKIGPGKAYVLGYERETVTTNTITVDKARTTRTLTNQDVYVKYAPYVKLDETGDAIDGDNLFSLSTKETLNFYAADGTTLVGTARIIGVDRVGTELFAYLAEARDLANAIATARTFENAGGTVVATIKLEADGKAKMYNVENNVNIAKMPESAIDTIGSMVVRHLRELSGTVNGSDQLVLSALPSGSEFVPTEGVAEVSDFIAYAYNNTTNTVIDVANLTIVSGAGTATVTIGDGGTEWAPDDSISVIARLEDPSASIRVKTEQTVTDEAGSSDGNGNFTLANKDVIEIVSVVEDGVGAVTDFTFDNGQRDFTYEAGVVGNLTASAAHTITYKYYIHSTGDIFVGSASYPAARYAENPTYVSEDGLKTYNLVDSIDFRRKSDDIGASVISAPRPLYNVYATYDHFLPRFDKVYVDQYGNFGVREGIASPEPEYPNDIAGTMTLYVIEVPRYGFGTTKIKKNLVDNRRYTMKDINALDNRLSTLEYYTSLNLLEQKTANMTVVDGEGIDRFKNGILVDNFTGHSVGDVYHPEYSCSIDEERGVVRPSFNLDDLSMASATGLSDIATHTHTYSLASTIANPNGVDFIVQDRASTSINVNPYNVFNWVGNIAMEPASDYWVDTTTNPDVIVNIDGGNDNWEELANAFETDWNSWQTVSVGSSDRRTGVIGGSRGATITTTTTTQQERTGTTIVAVPGRVEQSIGDRIVDTAIIPFMRSIDVDFTANGLRPNTQIASITFDRIDVSGDITWTSTDTTDDSGSISGTFNIPAGTFRTGTLIFRLADDLNNPTTSAEFRFVSQGLVQTQENTIISIDTPQLVQQNVTESRTLVDSSSTTVWADPLAQSFLVSSNGGVFLQSIDLYFKTKATNSNIPVTVYIVENDNGYPTQNIVTYSTVNKLPADVNVSADASVATTFAFSDPVYLQDGVEYSFVVISNCDEYNVHISEVGQEDYAGDVISEQPYVGVMFTSQNASTWSADQARDIKFNIKRYDFKASGSLSLSHTAPGSATQVTTIMPAVDNILFSNTGLDLAYQIGTDTPITINNKTNIDLDTQRDLNSTALKLNISLTTTDERLSPILSKDRAHAVIVNTDTAGTYITRTTELVNPSDDIRVIFDAKLPDGSTVVPYYRVENKHTPRYITVNSGSDAANMVGDTVYVYYHDDTTDAITEESVAVVSKVSGTTVYLKEISDSTKFDIASNIAGVDYVIMTSEEIHDGTVVDGTTPGGVYDVNDVFLNTTNNTLYRALKPGTGTEAFTDLSLFSPIETAIVSSIITEDTTIEWQPMTVETTLAGGTNIEENFVEYAYVPDEDIIEEFSSFAVKLVMTGVGVNIPQVKNLRVLALY